VKCVNCGDENTAPVYLTKEEKQSMSSGKGEANLIYRCKFCKRENSIDILEGYGRPYKLEDSGKYVPLAAFDCRGAELSKWDPRSGFSVKSTASSTKFNDINLEDDWTEYDEEGGESVSIMNLESKFTKIK